MAFHFRCCRCFFRLCSAVAVCAFMFFGVILLVAYILISFVVITVIMCCFRNNIIASDSRCVLFIMGDRESCAHKTSHTPHAYCVPSFIVIRVCRLVLSRQPVHKSAFYTVGAIQQILAGGSWNTAKDRHEM